MRQGEKLHESLITADEARGAREYPRYFVLGGKPRGGGKAVTEGFDYRSDTNTEWLDAGRLEEMVRPWLTA